MLRELFVIGAESESVLLRWSVRILSIYIDVQRKIQVLKLSRRVFFIRGKNTKPSQATDLHTNLQPPTHTQHPQN